MRRFYQSKDIQPSTTNPWKEKKEKTVEDKTKDKIRLEKRKGSALKTRQFHAITAGVIEIVPLIY